jgi:hypothetical protein
VASILHPKTFSFLQLVPPSSIDSRLRWGSNWLRIIALINIGVHHRRKQIFDPRSLRRHIASHHYGSLRLAQPKSDRIIANIRSNSPAAIVFMREMNRALLTR